MQINLKSNIMKNLTKNLIIISFITVLSTLSINGLSQANEFRLSDLAGKTWEMQGLSDKTVSDYYDDSQIKSSLNGKILGTFEYYLSDSIVSDFEACKVGIVNEGRYIISRLIPDKKKKDAPQPRIVTVYEIIELTKGTLVLKKPSHNHTIEFKVK